MIPVGGNAPLPNRWGSDLLERRLRVATRPESHSDFSVREGR